MVVRINTNDRLSEIQSGMTRELKQWKNDKLYRLYLAVKPYPSVLVEEWNYGMYIEIPNQVDLLANIRLIFGPDKVRVVISDDDYVGLAVQYPNAEAVPRLAWIAQMATPLVQTLKHMVEFKNYRRLEVLVLDKGYPIQ